MPHDNFSPSFTKSCKTNKLSETFRARNSFSLRLFRGHYQGLILIFSPVRQAHHRHGLVAQCSWLNPGTLEVLPSLNDFHSLTSRYLERLDWKTMYLMQLPCKSVVANPIIHPLTPDGLSASASRCTQDQQG